MNSPRERRGLLAALLLSLGFAWGFVSFWKKTFPFGFLKRAASDAGLLRPARPVSRSAERLASLRSLPYISGSYDPQHERRGVLLYAPEKCSDGYNLYSSGYGHCSYLIDMKGHVRWRWCAEAALGPKNVDPIGWVHLYLSRQGTTLLNVQEQGIFGIDGHSRRVWKFPSPTHHDLIADASGAVYAPEHRRRPGAPVYEEDILDDGVLVLDAAGKLLQEISLFDLFANSPYAYLLPRTGARQFRGKAGLEPFHLNHVEVFDGSLSALSPLFREGNLLVSMRHINCVAIVDPREKKLLWVWGPNNVFFQHDPTILKSGHVLIFDNGLASSEVVEVDPLSNRVVWKYAPAEGFFSASQGAAQRLENGNTLVTESDRGYAFEITPGGEMVWRFANPEVDATGFRSGIPRMRRYPKSELPFLLSHLPDPERAKP